MSQDYRNEIDIKCKEELDAWWVQEPFGYDHPETYGGIFLLIKKAIDIASEDNKLLCMFRNESDEMKTRLSSLEAELKSAKADCIKGRCGECGKVEGMFYDDRKYKRVDCGKYGCEKPVDSYCDEWEAK